MMGDARKIRKDKKQILSFFDHMDLEAKIIIVGAAAVGKTAIVSDITNDDKNKDIYQPTVGACYTSRCISVEGNELRLLIWDTAGQEKYHTLVPMYYRGAAVALIVYAVDDPESLREVNFWADSINQVLDPPPAFVLVGNKIDLEREVESSAASEIAQAIGAHYVEVSALENEGIDILVSKIGSLALEAAKGNQLVEQETVQIKTTVKKKKGCCK